jgi:hypothetical protein
VDMDLTEGQQQEEHLQNRDFRHRSFVALAGYLLTGERQSGGVPQFPESIPEAAAAYVRECLDLIRRAGKTPSPGDFIDKFEGLLSAPTVDLATRLRGSNVVAMEEMESVGSVSDFEDDWKAEDANAGEFEGEPVSPIKRGIKTHDFNPLHQQKRSLPWGAMAAAAVVVLGIGAWIFMGGRNESKPVAEPAVSSSDSEGPASSKNGSTQPVITVAQSKPRVPSADAAKPQPVAVKPPAVVGEANPPAKPTSAVVAAVPKPAVEQGALSRENEVKPTAKPEVDKAAATAVVTPAATSPQPAAAPVTPTTATKLPEKDPITIRRAIVPSKEEIDRMKQGQVENRTGQLPVMSTASPLPPKRKETP